MRLISLEFQAIGPFAGHHAIDFTRFEPSGLYLLRGQTGAGKSTIIDAITFALYGEVAGGNTSTKDRLRSNFAARNVDTFATLRFEVSSGFFEVTRRPAYVKDGNKNPTASSATLFKLGECFIPGAATSGTEVATGMRPVTEAVEDLIQLGLNQFLQTVVLPQGKFAEFIHSSPSERKELLEDIFDTEDFALFVNLLRARARDNEQAFNDQRLRVGTHAQTMSDEIAGYTDAGLYEKAIGASMQVRDQLYEEMQEHSAALEVARANLREAEASEKERARVESMTLRWREAQDKLARLDIELPEHNARVSKLAAAREAAGIKAEIRAKERAEASLDSALDAVEETASALHEDDAQLQTIGTAALEGKAWIDISERADELTQELTRIEAAEKDDETLTRLRVEIAQLEEQIEDLEEQARDDQDTLEQFKVAEKNIASAIDSLETKGAAYTRSNDEKVALEKRFEAARKADELREKLKVAAETVGLKARELEEAKAKATELTASWINDSALELAALLVEGEACVVCGSTQHPAPYIGSATHVTHTQLDEARSLVNSAQVALESAQARRGDLVDSIAEQNQIAGADSKSLEIALSEASEQVKAALAAINSAKELRQQLEEARAQAGQIATRLAAAQTSLAGAKQDLAHKNAEAKRLQVAIEAARASFESVAARREYLFERREAVKALAESLRAWQDTTEHLAEVSTSLDASLRASRFATVQAAIDALVDADEMSELEQLINSHEVSRRVAQETIAEAAASGFLREVYPAPLTRTIAHLRERFEECSKRFVFAQTQLEAYERKVSILREGIELLQNMQKEHGPIRLLAEKARGAALDDGQSISFDTWVVMRQFERVLESANPHLESFSGGRYEMTRVNLDASKRKQAAGLGVSIIDHETDKERAPASLSGGETFYSSLALALGLVEVISAEAGGLDLKSMLIDEGFGSLDQDALDKVMIGLQRLKDSGRTVGVVSHVAEMQQRISDGIIVTTAPGEGSTLRVQAADSAGS